jgi:hypothetical protein
MNLIVFVRNEFISLAKALLLSPAARRLKPTAIINENSLCQLPSLLSDGMQEKDQWL